MPEYTNKWNNYKVGEVPWINNRKLHPHIGLFVRYAINNLDSIKHILEIGAGECIEAQKLKELSSGKITYDILDVSDTFLKYASSLGFNTSKGDMVKTGKNYKQYDMVYCCCILEHSPDIHRTIAELARISKTFYLTLFKWKFKNGNLESEFHGKKRYYSSEFNLFHLMELIKHYGKIDKKIMSIEKTGEYMELDDYIAKYSTDVDLHRNRDYLSITGVWNG